MTPDPRPGREDGDIRPGRTRPLDMSKDPDRFDPAKEGSGDVGLDDLLASPTVPRLDPAADPDRFRAEAGAGKNLEEMLGRDRMYEDERNGFEWIAGLLAVLAFLAVVAYLFGSVLKP